MTAILYLFVYSSWGLGLLSALLALSMKLQEHSAKMKAINLSLESNSLEFVSKKTILDRVMGKNLSSQQEEIPSELRELINRSKGHPEVQEIDSEDQIVGVLFKAHSYPPDMEETDEDSDKQPST
jgi:hypothetical protein